IHARLAKSHEAIDAGERIARDQGLDVAFGLEAKLLFDLDFHPQALAIEAILVTLFVPRHREIALVNILVGAAPGVMHAHGGIGSDGAVKEAPARLARVLLKELLEDFLFRPKVEDGPFLGREIDLGLNLFEWHSSLGIDNERRYSSKVRSRAVKMGLERIA